MTDEDDNIVRPVFGSSTTLPERVGFCGHVQIMVDEHARALSCGACGAALDAFEVMVQYARRERSWRGWQREAREAQAQISKLREEEKRIKARVRMASRKDAQTAVADERKAAAVRLERAIAAAREVAEAVDRLRRLLLDEATRRHDG